MNANPSAPRLTALASLRSPFDNPAVLWLLVAVGLWTLYPALALQGVLGARLVPDSDDAMRLVEIRDLMAGQAWFDMSQHRLMPPAGASMHWSRFVDAPLAGLIGAATPLLGRALAEGWVVALWPPALFALYLFLLHHAVAGRFGPRAGLLALFCATQVGGLGPLFAFGRIDHHNVQVLAVVGLGLGISGQGRSWRGPAVAGALAAFSLAVGLETVPYLALAGLVLLGDWVLSGRTALPALSGFSTALAAGATVLFLGQTAPALWLVTACDALSPPWLWIAAAAAATAGGAALLSLRLPEIRHRAAYAAVVGLATIGGFVALFPACLTGPFHDLPPVVKQVWLAEVSEMLPAWKQFAMNPGNALAHLAPLLVAGLAAALVAARGPAALRRPALVAALFLGVGFGLGIFQFRGIYIGSAFVAFVAGPILDRAITLVRREEGGWIGPATLVLALLMIARIWAVPFAAAERFSSSASAIPSPSLAACTTRDALQPLDRLPPGVILGPIDLGPFLLLHTRHAVVAAPYHRAIPGLVASVTGLLGDEAALRRATASSGATYLALCGPAFDQPADAPIPFATRLARGEAPPAWLEPVPLGPSSPLTVWHVRP